MSYLRNVNVTLSDGAQNDAFGRLWMSAPFGLYEAKFIHNDLPVSTISKVSGTGASTTYLPQESAVSMASGTDTNSYAIKQTRMYMPYTPGKSMQVIMTAVAGAKTAACVRRIGMFDDYNGLFFEINDTLKVVERTNTSGTISDVPTAQASWNLDTMDGNGPSGVNIDTSKSQIFVIDYQWLGVGRVRYGFVVKGVLIYCHESLHANIGTVVYMKTPSLPMRWEIRKLSGSSSFTMKALCCSASSEAGYNPLAIRQSASRKGTLKLLNGTRLPIIAVRLKTAYGNSGSVPYVNRKLAKLFNIVCYADTDPIFIEVDHVTDPSSITGTFSEVSALSACEYSTDITAITPTYVNTIHQQYIPASSSGSKAMPGVGEMISDNGTGAIGMQLSQNYDSTNSQVWVVYATSLAGTPSAGCVLEWLEYD